MILDRQSAGLLLSTRRLVLPTDPTMIDSLD